MTNKDNDTSHVGDNYKGSKLNSNLDLKRRRIVCLDMCEFF